MESEASRTQGRSNIDGALLSGMLGGESSQTMGRSNKTVSAVWATAGGEASRMLRHYKMSDEIGGDALS